MGRNGATWISLGDPQKISPRISPRESHKPSILSRIHNGLAGLLGYSHKDKANLVKEPLKVACLTAILSLIIMSYWLLRTQKDGLFLKINGRLYIPYVKMGSVCMMLVLLLAYSKLIDMFSKHVLFFIVCGFYGCLFLFLAVLLNIPGMGLDDTEPSPYRLLGWACYLAIETFTSLSIPMFWSFANCVMDSQSAQIAFGIIIWGSQISGILAASLPRYLTGFTPPTFVAMGAGTCLLVPLVVQLFVRWYPQAKEGKLPNSRQTGVMEGIRLLVKHKYLMGLFALVAFMEVVVTTLDYYLKFELDTQFESTAGITKFMSSYGQWIAGITLFFSCFGTGFLLKWIGLTACLILFPVMVGVVITYVWLYPSLNALFYAMVWIKGLGYALNMPCKEILYFPTSTDVKYKTKGWIDMFGVRLAKSIGSVITTQLTTEAALHTFTGPINLCTIGVWCTVAFCMGRKNAKLQVLVATTGIPLGQEEPPHSHNT